MKENSIFKNLLKVILLIVILIISYLVCMVIFLSTFGTGGQGSQAIKNGYGILIIFVPIIITVFLGYKLFVKKN